MFKYVIILLIGICFEAAGVVYLSRGIKQINDPSVAGGGSQKVSGRQSTRNPGVWSGPPTMPRSSPISICPPEPGPVNPRGPVCHVTNFAIAHG